MWSTLNLHVQELQGFLQLLLESASRYAFWQRPVFSIAFFILYQFLVSRPLMLPSVLTLSLSAFLLQTAVAKTSETELTMTPSACEATSSLFLGRDSHPISYEPTPDSKDEESTDGFSSEDEHIRPWEKGDHAVENDFVDKRKREKKKKKNLPTLFDETERLKWEIFQEQLLQDVEVGCSLCSARVHNFPLSHAQHIVELCALREILLSAICENLSL